VSLTTTTYWTAQILPEGRRAIWADGVSRICRPEALTRVAENFDPDTDVPFFFYIFGPGQGRFRGGRVIGLEHRPGEGLWANFELDSTGFDYFQAKRMTTDGVSAHFSNDFRLEYVIGTSNPANLGMAGWERYR
jgi:hypothetical protein